MNTAVSERDPRTNVEVEPAAVPLVLTVTGAPRSVDPSLNCTVPTAVDGVIVAVNVTRAPWATGETGDTASAVVVAIGARASVG